MEPSAQNLTERAIAGDGDALGALWVEHRSWIAAVVLAVHGNSIHLEDTLQEIALAVGRDIGGLGSPGALRPWLRALARNIAVSAGRRAGRRRGLSADVPARARVNGEARGGRSAGADDLDDMMRLVGRLPEEYREPLLLRATRGMPVPVIGEILGLSPAAVETRLRRARAMLREAAEGAAVKGATR